MKKEKSEEDRQREGVKKSETDYEKKRRKTERGGEKASELE